MRKLSTLKSMIDFCREDDAATAVEYAVMLALITAVIIGAVATMAAATVNSFDESATAIDGAFN